MATARLIITAVVLEHRSQAEVARGYGVSKSWVSKLVARYHREGGAAFEPQSRAPNTHANATDPDVITAILTLRDTLTTVGLDTSSPSTPTRPTNP